MCGKQFNYDSFHAYFSYICFLVLSYLKLFPFKAFNPPKKTQKQKTKN